MPRVRQRRPPQRFKDQIRPVHPAVNPVRPKIIRQPRIGIVPLFRSAGAGGEINPEAFHAACAADCMRDLCQAREEIDTKFKTAPNSRCSDAIEATGAGGGVVEIEIAESGVVEGNRLEGGPFDEIVRGFETGGGAGGA